MVERKLFFAPVFRPSIPSSEPKFPGSGSVPKFSTSLTNSKTKGTNMQAKSAMQAAATAAQFLNDPNVQSVARSVGNAVSKVIKPPSDGGGRGMNGFLSQSPNPAQTELNTGIPLTLLEKNYVQVQENVCASMHTTHCLFTFPTDSTNLVYNWFMNISTRDFQTRVQEQVNWAVDISTKFSATNIMTAMNALYMALQYFFWYRSIISYTNYHSNQNDAMYAIEAEFTFNTLYKLNQISRLLSRIAIPPNMLELTRYLMSNYYSGSTPNSTILKIVPFPKASPIGTMTSDSNLDTVITNLTNPTNIDVWNTISRVCKDWVPGTPDKLYDPPLIPSFDLDFITIFNNLPSANGIVGKVYSPSAPDILTNVTYLSWKNDLDGISPALFDVYNSTTSKWINGTVSPQVLASRNRYSYYSVSGVKAWYGERDYQFLTNSRLDTYASNGSAEIVAHRFGSDMVINVSGQMLSTTAVNAIDFLISSSSIKSAVQSVSMPKPASYTSRGKSRRKSRDK